MERQIIGAGDAPASPRDGRPGSGPSVRRILVDEEDAGQRLDNLLLRLLKGVPKTHIYRVIRSGEVRLNSARARADTRVQRGDELRLPPMRLPARAEHAAVATPRHFPLLWEDEHLLAIDKPAGVAVHGGSGVSQGLIEQLRSARSGSRFLELVHRLDRETSGVLLVACRRSALTALQEQFRQRDALAGVAKTYLALVRGDWPASLKVLDAPLHKFVTQDGERRVRIAERSGAQGLKALTLVKALRRWGSFTLLEVALKTGRTHQIRVHLAAAGHPIAGDDKYGDFEFNRHLARGRSAAARLDRMFLHAARLQVRHPASGQVLDLNSPLPSACQRFLDSLDNPASHATL